LKEPFYKFHYPAATAQFRGSDLSCCFYRLVKIRYIIQHDYPAGLGELGGYLQLVVIGMLTEALQARYGDNRASLLQRSNYGADPRVRDNHIRILYCLQEGWLIHETLPSAPLRDVTGVPDLCKHGFVERISRSQQPIELLRVRTHGHEYQNIEPPLTALG
jgi:hypothetical protein